MASKAFQSVLARLDQTKRLDSVIVGSGFLGEGGPYDVTIQVVDTANIEEDRLRITYRGDEDKEHSETVFLLDAKQEGLSRNVRQLISGLFPDKDVVPAYLKWVMADAKTAFEALTGFKTRITLKYGKGYVIKADGAGQFAAYDSKTGDKLTDSSDGFSGAKDIAEALGLKRAYLNVYGFNAAFAEQNIAVIKELLEKRATQPTGASIGKMV